MDQNLIIKSENISNIETLHSSNISTIQLANIFRKKMIIKKLNDIRDDNMCFREVNFMKKIRFPFFPRFIGVYYSHDHQNQNVELKNKCHSLNSKTDNINSKDNKKNKKNTKNDKKNDNLESAQFSFHKSMSMKTSSIINLTTSSLCIVMENIKGISLDKFIEKGPEKALIHLHVYYLCRAIDLINQNSYIHKDVKTQM